ncbi:MAG: FAD binding domain-containing protein, partial [Lachnospiraceae bacterium]|nr:FAD binding domain-containing protein [Lachnospiraceae bacterium]
MFDLQGFHEAKDVADAVQALTANPNAEIISGGTDVLIRVREGKDAGKALVSIKNIEEIKGVKLLDNGDLFIGAGTC